MPAPISRKIYADMYGPTTGDKVRLADTELFIELEYDFTNYGDEVSYKDIYTWIYRITTNSTKGNYLSCVINYIREWPILRFKVKE